MARCSCGNASCSCVIKGKANGGVTVTGSGSPERPYEIELSAGGNALDSLDMLDSPTVEWSKAGAGTALDHRRYIATARVGMQELTDVSKTDTPVIGDVVQWNGSEWVFAAPGATSVPVSGVWGTSPLAVYGGDNTLGQAIYSDSNGQIRTRPLAFNAADAGITASSSGSAYPLGYSVMRVVGTDNTSGSGWPLPVASFGYVETLRALDSTNVTQIWHRDTGSTPLQAVWQRGYNGATWSTWTWVGGSPAVFSAFKPANQTMTTANTFYTITYDSVNLSENGIAYAGGVVTVPYPGKYLVDFNQHFQVTGSPTITTNLYQNAAVVLAQSHGSTVANRNFSGSRVLKCAAGDTIQLKFRSTVANTIAYGTAGTPYSTFDVTLIGG